MSQRRQEKRRGHTIHDVARLAEVSISTVSLALNSPDRVRSDTLARIYQAVQELGYIPKADAAVQARKGTSRIGIVAPFTAYGSFMERLRGAIAAAANGHYEIVLYDHQSYALRHHLVDSLPLSRRLDGLILMAIPISDRLAQRLLEDGLETILVEFARSEFSSVVIDDEEGGRLAAGYLLSKGHRRCAFIGEAVQAQDDGQENVATQKELRLLGFRAALAKANVELLDSYVLSVPSEVDSAKKAALQLLELPNPPTAIFTHSDVLAVGVLQAARERQIAVPGTLAVIGFDDREFANYMGLTTIRQPLYESGLIALRLLEDRLTGKSPTVPQLVRLPLEVVVRSTA